MKTGAFSVSVVFGLFVSACMGSTGDIKGGPTVAGYISIDPIRMPGGLFNEARRNGSESDPDLNCLHNNAVFVSTKEFSSDGSVSIPIVAVTKKNSAYQSDIDFIKYTTAPFTINIKDGAIDKDVTVNLVIGVGLRARASYVATSKKIGISVADPINIGISASDGEVSGMVSFTTIGLESKNINDSLPIPVELSKSNMINSLMTMASIKANVYDDAEIKLQVLGFLAQSFPKNISVRDVIQKINEGNSFNANNKENIKQALGSGVANSC